MSENTYILDDEGNPVPEPDLLKWASWFEDIDNRRIAETYFGDIHVSTVFLAMLHHDKNTLSTDCTMLFETMVFADNETLARIMELSETDDRSIIAMFIGETDIQKRYRMRDEALKGHQKMCAFLDVCINKGLL
jgi:hypothetical protein